MSEQFEVNYGNRLMAEALGIKLEHSKLLDEEGYSIPGHWVYSVKEVSKKQFNLLNRLIY